MQLTVFFTKVVYWFMIMLLFKSMKKYNYYWAVWINCYVLFKKGCFERKYQLEYLKMPMKRVFPIE